MTGKISYLITNQQMYELDRLAAENGVSGKTLMENAGQAVVDEILKRYKPCKIVILCGPGNNGGDGYIIARLLAEKNWDVCVAQYPDKNFHLKGDAAVAASKYKGPRITISPDATKGNKLIIDAIFGAGLSKPVEGIIRETLEAAEKSGIDIIAVDIPSGINGDTGEILGYAASAKLTVTFTYKKPGHLLLPGKKYCGEVIAVEIGHPEVILKRIDYKYYENTPTLWLNKFPWPEIDKHKYDRGHAVVVGGGPQMTGAARMAALSALRTSAGLVTIACPARALDIYAKTLLAVMVKPFDEVTELMEFIADKRRHAILIGPGAGVNKKTREMVLAILFLGKPCILDADAITVFSDNPDELFNAIKKSNVPVILTPHEGEFRRLFELTSDKIESVRNAARQSNAVIILKGSDTIIASPDGKIVINDAPPILATAGAGDVLAGIIVGLLASNISILLAACAGVWLHSESARLFNKPSGMISEDLINLLPESLVSLKRIQET